MQTVLLVDQEWGPLRNALLRTVPHALPAANAGISDPKTFFTQGASAVSSFMYI